MNADGQNTGSLKNAACLSPHWLTFSVEIQCHPSQHWKQSATLSQFFAEDEMVELTPELKNLFDKWISLTPEQKNAIYSMVNAFDNS